MAKNVNTLLAEHKDALVAIIDVGPTKSLLAQRDSLRAQLRALEIQISGADTDETRKARRILQILSRE